MYNCRRKATELQDNTKDGMSSAVQKKMMCGWERYEYVQKKSFFLQKETPNNILQFQAKNEWDTASKGHTMNNPMLFIVPKGNEFPLKNVDFSMSLAYNQPECCTFTGHLVRYLTA